MAHWSAKSMTNGTSTHMRGSHSGRTRAAPARTKHRPAESYYCVVVARTN